MPEAIAKTMTVAIVGAGPLGRSLALRAAQAGLHVVLEDVMPANLRHAQEALRASLGESLMAEQNGAAPRVRFATTIEDAVREAEIAIDCVPDELESKLEIFSLLDRMAPPRTILMTPMQAVSIADLAACTYRAERCVAIALPAQALTTAALTAAAATKIPLVRTGKTLPEVEQQVREFWQCLGCTVEFTTDGGAGR